MIYVFKYIKKLFWISMLCIKECKFITFIYIYINLVNVLTLREIK